MRKLFFLPMLVAFFSAPSFAATIANCDEIPHTIAINNAGELREHILPAGRSMESFGPMVSVSVEKGDFIRVQMRDVYCIRKGNLSLQMRRPYSSNRR